MGFGPGAAIGAKIGAPDRPVIALVGDGAMSSQLPVLPTAVEQGVSVVWLVMNNAAHGTIADLQMSHYGVNHGTLFKRPGGEPYTPDFAGIARACGAWGKRLDKATELAGALRDALDAGGPALIDVPMTNDPCRHPVTGTSTTSTKGGSIEDKDDQSVSGCQRLLAWTRPARVPTQGVQDRRP